jgi:hypothetical protein
MLARIGFRSTRVASTWLVVHGGALDWSSAMIQFATETALLREDTLTLTEATKLPFLKRNGKRPALTTLLRWARRGMHGHRLETVRIGRSLCTSTQAIERFVRAVSAADCHAPFDDVERARRNDAAEHLLAAEGI